MTLLQAFERFCRMRKRCARPHSRAGVMLSALLLSSIALVPATVRAAQLYAFGQSSITVPSVAAVGTVVAREYYTPQQICGKNACEVIDMKLKPQGGSNDAPGPDIGTNVSGLSTRLLFDGAPVSSSTRTTIRQSVEVQLFRNDQTPENGSLKPGWLNFYFAISTKAGFLDPNKGSNIYLTATVKFINGTCSVSDQTVMLPDVSQAKFSGVGSTLGTTGFQVRLSNCPAGFNRVGYQITPLNGAVDGLPGTLRLRPDSTATNIGIQIGDVTTGLPLLLSRSRMVTNYRPDIGGSATISLNAAYIQTDAAIRGGSVNAGAQILLDYL